MALLARARLDAAWSSAGQTKTARSLTPDARACPIIHAPWRAIAAVGSRLPGCRLTARNSRTLGCLRPAGVSTGRCGSGIACLLACQGRRTQCVPELTSQPEGGYAPCLPPLPPTHSGSGGSQASALSPSFAACSRGCSRAWAPGQDSDRRRGPLRIIGAASLGAGCRQGRRATAQYIERAAGDGATAASPAPHRYV
jgi:hypothetical protein